MLDGLNKGKSDYTSPHRYQVILEARFSSGGKDVTALYTEDRKSHPETKMYTLNPTAEFVLAKLFTPDAQAPELSSFRATVFRGHLERGGKPIDGLDDIVVNVKQVMHAQKFEPADDKPANDEDAKDFDARISKNVRHLLAQADRFDRHRDVA